MNAFDWHSVLTRRPDAVSNTPAEQRAFADFERRHGLPPPTDLAAVAAVTDGLDLPDAHPATRIRPLDKVRPVAEEMPDLVKVWGRMPKLKLPDGVYFGYADAVAERYRPAHLRHCLVLSGGEATGEGDAEILLNPQVIWPDGRWEVWMVAHWLPGVRRYRDLGEFLTALCGYPDDLPAWRATAAAGPPTLFTVSPGSARRIGKVADVPGAAALLAEARGGKYRARMRAVKAMAGAGGAEVGDYLVDCLADPDPRFRRAAAESVARRGDLTAVGPLIDLMEHDPEPVVRQSAAGSLGEVGGRRARAALLRAMEVGDLGVFTAAGHALARRCDPKAARMAMAEALRGGCRGGAAGSMVGVMAAELADDLLAALEHPDPQVRLRAACSAPLLPPGRLVDPVVRDRVLRALSDLAEGQTSHAGNAGFHLETMPARLSHIVARARRA